MNGNDLALVHLVGRGAEWWMLGWGFYELMLTLPLYTLHSPLTVTLVHLTGPI